MKRICFIVLWFWAATALAQVSSFRTLSQPEVSQLVTKAREGNRESQLRLGTAYQYGLGVDRDGKTAEYWLKIAAGFGDPEAQTQLGLLYLQPGFESSKAQALRWFMRAAASGFPRAEHNLGLMYTLGMGVPADRDQAIHWFRRASQHGLAASKANLGVLLVNSPNRADQEEGFKIVSATAKDGNSDAENALAYCYQFGAGTHLDMPKAVEFYQRASAHGNLLAMTNLGDMYRTGVGVEQNYKEAFRWYSQACNGGERRSCIAVANAYLHAQGVPRNEVSAYQFAMMAGADTNQIAALEKTLPAGARDRAAEEAERWKQAHAVQLSASPR
jgi:TPR repeat protein